MNNSLKKYEYIASGSYGCVYFVKHNNTVLKLFNNKYDWEREKKLNNIIKKIDPKNEFTVAMISNKIISNNDEKTNNNFNECPLINSYTSEFYEIEYEYGGIDLDDLFKKYDISKLNIIIFFKKFENIIKGIKTINEKGFLHFDIKLNNILYNPKTKKLYLIDFGLSNKYDIFFSLKKSYKYIFYPSELDIIHSLYYNKNIYYKKLNLYDFYENIFIDELNNIFYKHKINSKFYKIYEKLKEIQNKILIDLSEKSINNLIDLFKGIHNQNLNINEYFISICDNKIDIRKKIDVYLLGLCLLNLILYIFNYIKYNDTIYDIPLGLFDLIIKMIDINPCNRINKIISLNKNEVL